VVDSIVREDPGANIFHSSAWARVIADTYGYEPDYFLGEGLRGRCVVPMMEVRDFLHRRSGVGLPFSDAVPALGDRGQVRAETLDALVDFATRRKWRSIEIRDSLGIPGMRKRVGYVQHTAVLDKGIEAVRESLHDSIRRNIRKAERLGVKVRSSRDLEAMEGFYRLHCLTRRKHGIPPQPINFFRNLWRELITAGFGFVTCAFHSGRLVSASVFLLFGSTATYKYGASLESHHLLRANHLVMWRSIENCIQEGYRIFSLGRTDIGQNGLIRYKDGWGAEACPCPYTVSGGRTWTSARTGISAMLCTVVRRMPIPVLRLYGEAAYRYMA